MRTGRPLKSATVRSRARGVCAFQAFGVEEGWLSVNLLARRRMPTEERTVLPVLAEDQIDRLFTAAREVAYPPLRLRDEALLSLLFDTGARAQPSRRRGEVVMPAGPKAWTAQELRGRGAHAAPGDAQRSPLA